MTSIAPKVNNSSFTNTNTTNNNNNIKTTNKDEPFQASKQLVLNFFAELEACSAASAANDDEIQSVLEKYVNTEKYRFRSVYPFRDELKTIQDVADTFWRPLKTSFTSMQRRPDIFFAGNNQGEHDVNDNDSDDNGSCVWVLSMGHFLGNFDNDWLGIRSTRQMAWLRYAEFTKVDRRDMMILETGLFVDICGLMQSVGMNPLPPSTGRYFHYPGPRTHDGLLLCSVDAPAEEGTATQELVDKMVADLSAINNSMTCSPTVLERTWHKDMIWYGPSGIGASMTIERYQEQHQLPFRSQLQDKKFHGHVCRIAEGNYAAFFGWPNLTNSPTGGFLGLPGGSKDCPMQVVDVYRRDGDYLAENWVFIDMLWYLKQQGLDALERTTRIMNPIVMKQQKKKEEEEKH